ncbi:MAG TPA: acyltransferase [Kineosporiaceae bacterium]|nr:acyltransferase [Kineosporiaceae bacterium]
MDAGRGLAIVLVVLVHARDWLDAAGLHTHAWAVVNAVLAGLRMPLFFAMSGLLGAKWLTAHWPTVLSRKVAFLVWVYLLWQPIGSLTTLLAVRITGAHLTPVRMAVSLALTPVRPRYELWFLWAPAIFFVLARLTARIPVRVQLLVAGAGSAVALSGLVPNSANPGWAGVPTYYVFFLIGCHYAVLIRLLADRSRRSPWFAVGLIGIWAAVATTVFATRTEHLIGPGLAIRLLGLAAGVALAVLLGGVRLLRHLGARTLPIYLAHNPIIIALVWIVQRGRGSGWVTTLTPALPLLFTVLAVPMTLALYAALTRTTARVLYAPPPAVTALVARVSAVIVPRPPGRHRAHPAHPALLMP